MSGRALGLDQGKMTGHIVSCEAKRSRTTLRHGPAGPGIRHPRGIAIRAMEPHAQAPEAGRAASRGGKRREACIWTQMDPSSSSSARNDNKRELKIQEVSGRGARI